MKQLLPLLALLAAPAAAQQNNRDVVVTGRAIASPGEAQTFVAKATMVDQGHIARFHKPVCPLVLGVTPTVAQTIAARLRETARGVGAKVAALPCQANLTVIITEDGSKFMTDVRRTSPGWVHGLTPAEIRALINERAPARAWAVVSERNADGVQVSSSYSDEPRSSRALSASILYQATRLDIDAAFVAIDRSVVAGKSAAQIADYVAMRGLARTRPVAQGPVHSILSLFQTAGERAVAELTRTDILYLQSLYRFRGTETPVDARARLARDISR